LADGVAQEALVFGQAGVAAVRRHGRRVAPAARLDDPWQAGDGGLAR
jgi:hypothetical protein